MLDNATIAVVIPCYNEETLIGTVLDTMPDFVDRIYVVDDKSSDRTVAIARERLNQGSDSKITVIEHEKNQGVGGAIATGYKAALRDAMDVTAVMAGDAQMDPEELIDIVTPGDSRSPHLDGVDAAGRRESDRRLDAGDGLARSVLRSVFRYGSGRVG